MWKRPATDSGKDSKRGRLALVVRSGADGGAFATVREGEIPAGYSSLLETVYENGRTPMRQTLDDVRRRTGMRP